MKTALVEVGSGIPQPQASLIQRYPESMLAAPPGFHEGRHVASLNFPTQFTSSLPIRGGHSITSQRPSQKKPSFYIERLLIPREIPELGVARHILQLQLQHLQAEQRQVEHQQHLGFDLQVAGNVSLGDSAGRPKLLGC